MADILLLPSASRYNRYWAEDLKERLDRNFGRVAIVRYESWNNTRDEDISVTSEISEAYSEASKLDSDYVVVAYQEGVAVALGAIKTGKIKPSKCIFIGMPHKWSRGERYDDEMSAWLSGYSVPTLYVQAENDPNCTLEELKQLISRTKHVSLAPLYGRSDSNYDNVSMLAELTRKFAG